MVSIVFVSRVDTAGIIKVLTDSDLK